MTLQNARLPQFVRDLLASPPQRGGGLNSWFYRVARVLHPYRTPAEIIATLTAATAGEPVKPGEIERAVGNSAAAAWKPDDKPHFTRQTAARFTAEDRWHGTCRVARVARACVGFFTFDFFRRCVPMS